ncbi:MAG: hypothetical protein JWP13_401 [Candidatus Saccharibacteria bacterium]|nr:hypothetical protein [Candidatus Saccharibacteria bacterium]
MRKASLKKIKSAPKPLLFCVVVGGLLVVAALLASFWPFQSMSTQNNSAKSAYQLRLDGVRYVLETAFTPQQQEKGLGGRERLAESKGMLFWYPREGEQCFWMKDMRFPIDIIWVSANKHVTHLEESLSPSTYPQTFCAQGQYVIELDAGEVVKHSLNVGAALDF